MRRPLDVIRAFPPHGGTLPGLVASRLARAPTHPAVRNPARTLDYPAFAARIDAAARALAARGLAHGDRVAAMAPNCADYVVLLFALARLGAVLVPVNPEFGAQEAGYVVRHAGVRALATTPASLAAAREAACALPEPPWCFLLEGEAEGLEAFEHLVAAAPAAPLPPPPAPADTVLLLYTSGTTGFPKGVMHPQSNFVMAGEAFVERLWLQHEDVMLCILPMFHINALFYSVAGCFAAGASLALVPKFSASGFWRTVADTGATQVNIIAAIGNILVRRPRHEFVPGHRLRVVYGAPVSREIERTFREEFGVPKILEGYGMTEIPGAANNPCDGENRIGSFGLPARHPDPAIEFAELKVVDEDGCLARDGVAGELLVRTPILMQGYWRDPEQTAAAMDGEWFRTGDLVVREPDGYFRFVARRKDIIRRRGENISGAEIDRVAGEHPAVLLCAAIPVPSELGEDEILLAVVPRPGAAPDARELAAWCAARLAPVKVPRYVAIVESLPMTPTQRVQKFQLRGDAALLARAVDLAAL